MAVVRVVSIGFASRHEMVEWVEELHTQAVQENGDIVAQVAGSDGSSRLDLVLVDENMPELTEPIVDFREEHVRGVG